MEQGQPQCGSLWSNVRAGNHFISRHGAAFGVLCQGLTYTDILFICQAQTLIYQREEGGGVTMAVVNPETASVTTTRDSSPKIIQNQITKQTAKRISSDLSPFFSPHQTDIKSAICKIPSNDFLVGPRSSGHILGAELFLLPCELCPFVLPRGLEKLLC